MFFLVSGFAVVTENDVAKARSIEVEPSIYLADGDDNTTVVPDDDPVDGDRGNGDDDAPGETVKLESSRCKQVSPSTLLWFSIKTPWAWMLFF
ncbi:hypothetical protein H8E52_00930 [bacterium]|nr:hypothetical protein [bacterium]